MQALRAVFAQSIEWWGRELIDMLPAGFRPSVGHGYGRALVRLYADATQFDIRYDDTLLTHRLPALEALDEATGAQLADQLQTCDVSIVIPESQLYRFSLQLPAEARGHLRQAAAYQLSTHAPIDPSQLLFDLEAAKTSGNSGHLDVEVAVARSSFVDALSARWTALGMLPPSIGWAPEGEDIESLSYVFQRVRRSDLIGEGTKQARLLACLGTIVIAAPLVIWGAATALEATVRQDIDRLNLELRPKIAATAENARLERVEEQLTTLLNKPRAVPVIEALATALPEKAWIAGFRYDQNEIQLQGIGAEGGQATMAVRRTPLLQEARLQSASDDPQTGGRFAITIPLQPAPGEK